MEKIVWLSILAVSLTVNGLLLIQLLSPANGDVGINEAIPTHRESDTPSEVRDAREALQPSESTEPCWEDFAGSDFRALHAKLVAMGCPEHTVKAIVGAQINETYRPLFREHFRRAAGDFWESTVTAKSSRRTARTPEHEEAEKTLGHLETIRKSLMKELIGRDRDRRRPNSFLDSARDLDSGHDSRLSFLSEEKRERIREQNEAIPKLQWELRSQRLPENEVQQYVEALQAGHRAERAQFLSPDELEEYSLRTSPKNYVVSDLYGFEPTSDERRSIIRLHEAHNANVPDDELRTALGDERFVQFQRGKDRSFHEIYKVATFLGLDEEQMIALYAWKQSAEQQATAVRANKSLPPDQRHAELESLRQQTDGAITGIFGEAGREIYGRNGGYWIDRLAEAGQ